MTDYRFHRSLKVCTRCKAPSEKANCKRCNRLAHDRKLKREGKMRKGQVQRPEELHAAMRIVVDKCGKK